MSQFTRHPGTTSRKVSVSKTKWGKETGLSHLQSKEVAKRLWTIIKELVKKPKGRTFLLEDLNW